MKRVYLHDADGINLMVIGSMTASKQDGQRSTDEFLTSISLCVEGARMKIRQYQVLVSGAKKLLEYW